LVGAIAVVALVACSGDSGSAEELCEIVRTDRTVGAVFSGFDPTDTERALEQLRAARVTLGELHDAAPDEVRDDLTTEIEYVQALIDGLEGVTDGDPERAVEVVQQVTDEHEGVGDAAAALAAFSQEHCEP
jgi:hypothetical protein